MSPQTAFILFRLDNADVRWKQNKKSAPSSGQRSLGSGNQIARTGRSGRACGHDLIAQVIIILLTKAYWFLVYERTYFLRSVGGNPVWAN